MAKPKNPHKSSKTNPKKPKSPDAKKTKTNESQQATFEEMRLNKYVAHCGICARRKANEHIKNGSIKVNDQTVHEPGYRVKKKDRVTFNGKIIRPVTKKIYILLNKPKNCVTTVNDEKGRRTVIDIVRPKIKERIFPVGRLDRATVGLLLLTNDGDLAKKLSHPSHEVQKVYHVVLDRAVSEAHIEQIQKGLQLEDGIALVDKVGYVNNAPKNEIGIEIHIGRNRIVRRIFEHFGYVVQKLDRVYYAGLTKKDLPRGWFRHLTDKEIIMLKHFK